MTEHRSDPTPSPMIDKYLDRRQASEMLWQDIKSCEGLEVKELVPRVVEPIDDLPPTQGDRIWTELPGSKENVASQKLLAVVGAGAETFGIVRIDSYSNQGANKGSRLKSAVVVTRIGGESEDGVEVVGAVDPRDGLRVGRDQKPDYDKSLSRDHFVVGFMDDWKIGVMDCGSTQGTRLVTGREEKGYVEATKGIAPGNIRFITQTDMERIELSGIRRAVRSKLSKRKFDEITRLADQHANPFDERRMIIGTWNANVDQVAVILR